ncbi:13136_t:CDS:2 [Dentiscutata erythropus]|uniref:13136_t:CDS:1 n=1 Tax=Dentiscutata erythropus TaxID=1348616 RepID=A0A9N9GJ62_9GLOM|nr:13136_t:CDS:2 [Dentiscutata erythropus]
MTTKKQKKTDEQNLLEDLYKHEKSRNGIHEDTPKYEELKEKKKPTELPKNSLKQQKTCQRTNQKTAPKTTNLLKNQLKNDEQNLLEGLHKCEKSKKQNTRRHQNTKNLKKKKTY